MKTPSMWLPVALCAMQLVSAVPHRLGAEGDAPLTATVELGGHASASDSTSFGTVTFTQAASGGPVSITLNLRGVKPAGKHGFHVHQKADFSKGCKSAGGHFNPMNLHHGAPTDKDRHVGDLGNIVVGEDGVAKLSFTDNVISLTGENSIIGRSVVLHAGEDDLGHGTGDKKAESLKTGNAGGRLACGEIKRS